METPGFPAAVILFAATFIPGGHLEIGAKTHRPPEGRGSALAARLQVREKRGPPPALPRSSHAPGLELTTGRVLKDNE